MQHVEKYEHAPTTSSKSLVTRVSKLIKGLNWLSPVDTLKFSAGREFGRQIETSINQVIDSQKAMLIRLRNRNAAIVITVPQYEELIRLKNLYEDVIEKVKEMEIAEAGDEFDQLFQRIKSNQTLNASDHLFSAPPEAFSSAYKPGKTERN